jgi:transposase
MEYIVGIDISKASLDCHNLQDDTSWKVSNDTNGWEALVKSLNSVKLIVVEATGGYQEGLVDTFLSQNLPVAVVNPRQVRDFAKSAGRLAKTDRLDAEIIARFGLALNPTPQTNPSEIKGLRDLVTYRDDLLKL